MHMSSLRKHAAVLCFWHCPKVKCAAYIDNIYSLHKHLQHFLTF